MSLVVRVTATAFKAHCLSLMDQVERTGRPLLITKRGRVVAQLAPAPDASGERPWLELRGSVRRMGDVLSPVVSPEDIVALR